MEYFTVYNYDNYIYQIKDSLGVLSTLIVGSNKALLFDTGYGIGNLKNEVEKIIKDLPLIVVNSHGHMDHTCGNFLFDIVYIHPLDIPLCMEHNSVEMRLSNVERAKSNNVLPINFDIDSYINKGYGSLRELKVGDIFDLGNVKLEVIMMEGHTQGSIGLFDRVNKILYVGDATCPFVWLFLNESLPLHLYIEMLERTLKLDFEYFFVGHGSKKYKKEDMQKFLSVAKDVNIEKSFKVSFDGFDDCNSYCFTHGKLYGPGDCGIVFDSNKM